MTVPTRTLTVPDKLLTAAEFFALGDGDDLRRLELQEGNLVMAASATPRHMRATGVLYQQLTPVTPTALEVLFEVDVDLRLVAPDRPGTIRCPDLVVVTRENFDRAEQSGQALQADGVVLAVEILSPASRRTDLRIKRDEYADAGIPHYWVVDLDPRPSLRAFALAEGRYRDAEPVVETFRTEVPFPVRLDLDALV